MRIFWRMYVGVRLVAKRYNYYHSPPTNIMINPLSLPCPWYERDTTWKELAGDFPISARAVTTSCAGTARNISSALSGKHMVSSEGMYTIDARSIQWISDAKLGWVVYSWYKDDPTVSSAVATRFNARVRDDKVVLTTATGKPVWLSTITVFVLINARSHISKHI